MTKEIEFEIHRCKSREEVRQIIVSEFLKEQPGNGKGDLTSRYIYYVETLADGKRIYLKRPARLNKGFDFTIHVEGMKFLTKHDYPKHEDIMKDLRRKKRSHPRLFNRLYKAIYRVYECEDMETILKECRLLNFHVGYPTDLVLQVTKWFFIEQDVTYWNWSGRSMFMDGVRSLVV
jgi:hypothetical protein